jgi:hypothetical protein
MRIQAYTHIGMLLNNGRDSGRMTVSGVGKNKFVCLEMEASKPLPGAYAGGRGELETIALQVRKTEAVMNAPLASGRPWLADYGCIKQAQCAAQKTALQLDPVFLPKLLAQLPQPRFRIAQPIQKSHIGHIGNAR